MKRLLMMLVMLMVVSPVQAKVTFPDRGQVALYDPTHVLADDQQANLNQKLVDWQKKTQHQMVIAIIPDLQGLPITDYGYQLGRAWHLGRTGQDDAILMLVNPKGKTNSLRIEVGSGLESVITDAKTHEIRTQVMNPAYRSGGLYAALSAGTQALTTYIDTHEKDIPVRNIGGESVRDANVSGTFVMVFAGVIFFLALAYMLWNRKEKKPVTPAKDKDDVVPTPSVTTTSAFRNSVYASRTRNPTTMFTNRSYTYPDQSAPNSQMGDMATGAILGAAAASLFDGSDNSDDDDNRSRPADDGFASDNTDFNNFAGGGDSGDLGDDN